MGYVYGGNDFSIPKPYERGERDEPTCIGRAKHGTPAGYAAHRRRDIPMCTDCSAAEVKRAADRRAKKKAAA